MYLVNIPFKILFGFYLMSAGQLSIQSVFDFMEINDIIASKGNYATLFNFLQEFVIIVIPMIAWRFFEKKSFKDMGFGNIMDNKKDLLIGLLFGALSMTIVFMFILLTDSGELAYSLLKPKISIWIFVDLLLFIAVGFAEEILGRGYIMTVLKQTRNIYVVMIVSAVIFSLLHISNPNVSLIGLINIVLVGILFSYMYVKSGGIWMPIGYHITWNYFQGNIFGFQVSGLEQVGIYKTKVLSGNIINGGAFGPEGGIATTVVIMMGILFVAWYYRNSDYEFLPKKVSD
jgi:membrane protease YdiL (CAAX protease family)